MKLQLILALVVCVGLASDSLAVVVATTDFESPGYSLSNVEGQGGGDAGWITTWDNLYATPANVSDGDANGGSQSLQFVSTGSSTGGRVTVIRDFPQVNVGTTNEVTMKFDLNVSSLQNGLFIIYGLDNTDNQVGPEITLEHTDSNTHLDVLRRDGASNGDSGVDVNGNTWNTFELISNMETNTFSWSLNGIVQESGLNFRGTPSGLGRLRLWSTYAGGVSFVDNVEISVEAILPANPILEVQRRPGEATGSVVLSNMTGENVDILGYTIRSATSALSEADWIPITGNYDNTPVTGDGSVDSDDVWSILSENTAPADLSEGVFGISGPNTAGTLANGAQIDLGNIWVQTSNEDLTFELLLADGSIVTPDVLFTGNGDEAFDLLDLNTDGTVDTADWIQFRDNHPTTGALASTAALSHRLGDLDGDLDSDGADFVLFKSAYTAEFGAAAFAALVSGTTVPEPSASVLLLLAGLGYVCVRARGQRWVAPSLAMFFVGLFAAPAQAVITEGWWRMGDSDTSPVVGNTISSTAGMGVEDEYKSTDDDNELFHELVYSDDIPSPTIFDPGTETFYQNTWSTRANAPGDRASAQNATSSGSEPRTAVTMESFVKFETITGGNGRLQFLYQRNNSSGGWELSSLANGGIQLNIDEPDTNGGDLQSFFSDPNVLQAGVWHHVALVANPDNSGNDDVKVYVDGAEVLSDNYTLGDGMPDTTNQPLIGVVFDNEGSGTPIFYDETRYFREARSPDEFLQFGALTAVANTVTGELSLTNNGFHAIELDNYRLLSPGDRLLTDWGGMGNRDAVTGGDDPGETWEKSGILDTDDISEVFLLGSTSIGAGQSISLGTGYLAGAEDAGLSFTYHDVQLGKFIDGFIEFTDVVGGLPGDFNDDGTVNIADYTVWRNNLGGPESALNGNGDDTGGSTGVVDAADYSLWKSNFGASGSGAVQAISTNIPEPAAATILLLAACGLVGSRRIRSGASVRIAAFMITAFLVAQQCNAVTVDRSFSMGDTSGEGGGDGPMQGEVASSTFGSPFDVLDGSISNDLDEDDLENLGDATYHLITASDTTLGHPGSIGSSAIEFNGAGNFLADVNHADGESFNTIASGTSQGLQLWVFPHDESWQSTFGQSIVFDSANAGGPGISPDGKWSQVAFGHSTDIPTSVEITEERWYHVAQHIFLNSDDNAPNVVPGTGSADPNTSVIYVDGVAVSALNDVNFSSSSPLMVGAAEFQDTNLAFFDGVLDELEIYSSEPNEFDLFTDNDYIADIIQNIPNGGFKTGDITLDGLVDEDDVDALIAGWQKTKILNGIHNNVYVGDLETYGWGDLNLDGAVNLADAYILHSELPGGLNFSLLFGGGTRVPEPGSLLLLAAGAVGLAVVRNRA